MIHETEKKLLSLLSTSSVFEETSLGNSSVHTVITGSGPDVLLIHGSNVGWGQWFRNIAHLSKHFTVHAIDLPGAGLSSSITYSHYRLIENHFLDAIYSYIEQKKLQNFHIIGSSIGGWIALKLAIEKKVVIGKIVLISPVGLTKKLTFLDRVIAIRPVSKLLGLKILHADIKNFRFINFMYQAFYSRIQLPFEFINYFLETNKKTHGVYLLSKLSSIIAKRKELVLINEIPTIENKTLICWGIHDQILPLAQSQKTFPLFKMSEVCLYKKSGHALYIEQSEHFNEKVTTFLL